MKYKYLFLTAIAALSLTACSPGKKDIKIEDYFLSLDMKKDSFKILQLTDPHMGDKDYQDKHLDFMQLTIDDAKKDGDLDFIVVTGDLFTFASKSTADRFFAFLDKQGVPWTVTLGNHDEQCYFSVDWLTDRLNNYGSNCVFKDLQSDDIHGSANFVIDIKKGDEVFEQLYIMDSNRYLYGSYFGYDYFHKEQIEWYSKAVDYTTERNGRIVDSLMFYHIPLPEINDAYAYGVEHGTLDGEKREKTCPPDENTGFFNVIKEKKSTKAMMFGHDHVNDFRVKYEGVIFSYGVKSTDRIYYAEDMMGGQTIEIKADHSLEFNRIFHTYKDLEVK